MEMDRTDSSRKKLKADEKDFQPTLTIFNHDLLLSCDLQFSKQK